MYICVTTGRASGCEKHSTVILPFSILSVSKSWAVNTCSLPCQLNPNLPTGPQHPNPAFNPDAPEAPSFWLASVARMQPQVESGISPAQEYWPRIPSYFIRATRFFFPYVICSSCGRLRGCAAIDVTTGLNPVNPVHCLVVPDLLQHVVATNSGSSCCSRSNFRNS